MNIQLFNSLYQRLFLVSMQLPTGMDTTPLSCREVISMKNPVVASKVGVIHEMVHYNKTGFYVSSNSL